MDIYRKEPTEDELVEMLRNRELDRFADKFSNIILNSSQRAIDEVESEGKSSVTAEPSLLEVSESEEVDYTSPLDDESHTDEDGKKHYNCWERNHILTFRVNDDELAMIDERFHKHEWCKNRGDYLRQAATQAFIFSEDKELTKEVSKNIARVASNINQIAHRVNATGSIYADDIAELQKGLDKIWQSLMSIQSEREHIRQFNTSLTALKTKTAGLLLAAYVLLMHTGQASSFDKSVKELVRAKQEQNVST